ncbi:MAG: metallophosphoesterase family protein, partial [Deltaproteobacteria bacterium]|nr:metallophosphoesterase family protein [Deltaproteobacteria bacterium]
MMPSSMLEPRRGASSSWGPKSLACLSVAALSLAWTGEVGAAPQYVRLSFTDATNTTMTVTWNTAADVVGEVRYGTGPGNLTQTATGISNLGPGPMGYIHEVTLTGLQPDTLYYYQAGEANDGYSAENSFVTGPTPHQECGEFSFLFLGDNRPDPLFPGSGQNYDQILQEAEAHNAAFLLNGGDMVVDGDQLDQWAAYLGYSESSSAFMPFMTAIGNHDDGPGEGDSAFYNRLFALPTSTGTYGSNTEDYYYFVYGNAIFVALSTDTFKGGSNPFQTQADWLDEVLTQHPQLWKIVYFHKPIYTSEVIFSISHEPNEEGQNAAFVSVFDAHHVDVVLTSHNHWYERYEPS